MFAIERKLFQQFSKSTRFGKRHGLPKLYETMFSLRIGLVDDGWRQGAF